MLLLDERVVLRAPAPPEAEYALFDASEIELRSSEPGRVREHGYVTTAEAARARLDDLGATPARARETAATLQPFLARSYARGPAVEKITKYLAPVELLATEAWDPTSRSYRGTYLDLAALSEDLDRPHSSAEMQILFLALLLEHVTDGAKVMLTTEPWTKTRRPGERTYRRPSLGGVAGLKEALLAHADVTIPQRPREALPRQDVVALLRTKADAAEDDDERALFVSLQSAVTARERPERGPLAEPKLWALEQRIDAGQLGGIVEQIEIVERETGRTPGTTYLRGRASLLLNLEPAKLVAERVSALALSMTSFQELSLLAAEAWLEAGDPRRALPYARDLVDAAGIEEGLRLRAQRVLARVVGAAPSRLSSRTLADSIPAPLPANQPSSPSLERASQKPSVSAPDPGTARTFSKGPSRTPTVRGTPPKGTSPPVRHTAKLTPPPLRSPPPAAPPPAPSIDLPPPAPSSVPARRPGSAPAFGGSRPPELELDLPPPPVASFTLDLPGEEPPAEPPAQERTSGAPSRPSRRRMTGARVESVHPKSIDPRAEPDDPPIVPPIPPPRAPRIDSALLAAAPTPVRGTPAPKIAPAPGTDLLHGALLPAYRVESSPLTFSRTSRNADEGVEVAEHLSLPPGAPRDAALSTARPKTPLEARVRMTFLARELGKAYREKRGIQLRTDLDGLEALQGHLLEVFREHRVPTAEEARDVERHGALVAEILVRRLGGEWADIANDELGYWAMIVPPDVRIWPFGRIARLIANGHRERDLVSTFLELTARAAGAGRSEPR